MRPVESRRRGAIAGEVEGFRKLPEAPVGKLQCKTLLPIDSLGQHLAHERLAIDHVLEAKGRHGEIVKPVVLQEVFRRCDCTDIGEEVRAVFLDIGALGDDLQRPLKIADDLLVTCDGADHCRGLQVNIPKCRRVSLSGPELPGQRQSRASTGP